MAQHYAPPKQGGMGQFIDSILLMVLVFICLLAPVYLKADHSAAPPEEAKEEATKVEATWQGLGQTPVQAQQWEKLGHTPETAKPIIDNRFDYAVDPMALIVTIAVIVGYFVFVFRISDREYREVVRERFGDGGN
ncbi:MAG: hypothetical protein K2X67_04715 [Burkholderiales bacterium]|nr:hypothetical protein [Burkholderiales bacterium]